MRASEPASPASASGASGAQCISLGRTRGCIQPVRADDPPRRLHVGGVLGARIERPAVVAPALTPALRRELSRVAVRHGLRHVRLFGSFARGEAGADSDVDLLVQIPDSMTLWGLTCAADELSEVAGMRVDVVPDSNLRPGVRERVLAEAIPL